MTNKAAKTLIQTIAENTIGLITTAIFSVGMLGGSGYLLFDAQNELNKMAQTNAVVEKEVAELRLGLEMATLVSPGLFKDDQDAAILGTALGFLKVNLPNDLLDDNFSANTVDWYIKTLTQLNSNRAKIGGYVFENKIIAQSQSAILKVYDAHIILIQEMLSLTQNWQQMNSQERRSQFDVIQLKWIDVQASVDSLDSSASQLRSDIEIALKQNEIRADEFTDNYNSFNLRLKLSILGILLGLVLFSGTIIFSVRKHNQPQRMVAKIPARKTTKAKSKRK